MNEHGGIGSAGGVTSLTAIDAHQLFVAGKLCAVELVEAQLAHIATCDPEIGAFAFRNPEIVLAQATVIDHGRKYGRSSGALCGVSVGIKDIIDTYDMPTENGTSMDAGRRPSTDATVVRRLRNAGAVILGKTVTTELAYFAPGKTRNPANLAHTPGGSSSGSAAAVAAGMLPVAIGTQTNGSVIRPASFCGVVGFKPTHGLIPRTGILKHSRPLDTVGIFARTIEDVGLVTEVLAGPDVSDDDTQSMPPSARREATSPTLAFIKTSAWAEAEESTKQGLVELASGLGEACAEVVLPAMFAESWNVHRTLMLAGFARSLRPYYDRGPDELSSLMREAIEEGMKIANSDYLAALDCREFLNAALNRIFEKYDAIMTPAAPGEAPAGLGTTGSPVFNGLWTLCGTPAITLPLLKGPHGMPIGVQLVGRRGEDARLLRVARWLIAAAGNQNLKHQNRFSG